MVERSDTTGYTSPHPIASRQGCQRCGAFPKRARCCDGSAPVAGGAVGEGNSGRMPLPLRGHPSGSFPPHAPVFDGVAATDPAVRGTQSRSGRGGARWERGWSNGVSPRLLTNGCFAHVVLRAKQARRLHDVSLNPNARRWVRRGLNRRKSKLCGADTGQMESRGLTPLLLHGRGRGCGGRWGEFGMLAAGRCNSVRR